MMIVLWASVSLAQSERPQVWAVYLSFWTGPQSWEDVADFLDDLPLLGKYNSKLPATAAQHIAQAQTYGLDAFLVSWFGVDERVTTTPALLNLLARAEEASFAIGALIDVYNPAFNRDYERLSASLAFLMENVIDSSAYLRYQGKPVIAFAFQNEARFTVQQWRDLRQRHDPQRRTWWIAEGLNACCLYADAMDGMYAFNMAWASGNADYYIAERNLTLERGASLYIPSISPGWDEDKIARAESRPRPTSPRSRAEGQFLAKAWQAARQTEREIVIISTWNEFMENSHIEPSERYGTRMLETLRDLMGAPERSMSDPTACYAIIGETTVYEQPQGQRAIGQLQTGQFYTLLDEDYGYYALPWQDGVGWAAYDEIQLVPCPTTS
jgi:hypothetical protein